MSGGFPFNEGAEMSVVVCRNCSRPDDIVPVRPRIWELVLLPLLIRPFRCDCCGARAYGMLWGKGGHGLIYEFK